MIDFGVAIFPTDGAIQPAEMARAAEERGFESLFFPEHTHIPASRETPFPQGGEMPPEYWHMHDPFVALAAAAAATTTIKLAFGVCLVAQRDPIITAKEVASLDLISSGRVILGIGAGWNAEELANHGVALSDRWEVTRERVLAMRAIWTQEEPEFHGRFVDFAPIRSYPKPVQPGGPPILLGANATQWAYARIVDYCDGWMPLTGRYDLPAALADLEATAARAGRTMDTINLTAYQFRPLDDPEQGKREARELIELGFDRLVFGLPPASADIVLPMLDRYADFARRLS